MFTINTSCGELNDHTQGSFIPVSFFSRNKAIHSVLQGLVLKKYFEIIFLIKNS